MITYAAWASFIEQLAALFPGTPPLMCEECKERLATTEFRFGLRDQASQRLCLCDACAEKTAWGVGA